MQATPFLSSFYNKLIEVQVSARVTQTLDAEIFHHLNNGAAVLMHYLRRDPDRAHEANKIIAIANDVATQATTSVLTVMEAVTTDIQRLPVERLLLELLSTPGVVTEENYNVMQECRRNLHANANALRDIRRQAEISMFERSNVSNAPLDMNAEYDGIRLADYYNRLSHVQMTSKVLSAQRSEITQHIALNVVTIKGLIKDTQIDEFTQAEAVIVKDVNTRMMDIMGPISMETKDMNVGAQRLVTLVQEPGSLTAEKHEMLRLFQDRLNTVGVSLFLLRKRAEVDMLKASGLIGPAFTI